MPCIFCIAAIAMIAGAVATAAADRIEAGLTAQAAGPVRRAVDTDSVAKWELDVKVGSKTVPVAVTLFKDSGRVRIQILTHVLSAEQIQELFERLCLAIEADLVSQSDPADEADDEDHDHDEADIDAASEPEAEAGRQAAAEKPTRRREPR